MNARLLLLLAAPFVLASCQKKDETSETAPAPAAVRAETPLAADSAEVRNPSGAVLATLKTGSVLEAVLGPADRSRTLRGTLRENGKREYAQVGGASLGEVKPGDEGFKLKTPDSRLLWKVKLKDGKIKISDNEENARPVVVKVREGFLEVENDGVAAGTVRYDAAAGVARVLDATGAEVGSVKARGLSAGWALLLVARMPEAERCVLQLELLSRGL